MNWGEISQHSHRQYLSDIPERISGYSMNGDAFALLTTIRNLLRGPVNTINASTVDSAELAHYEAVADGWWDIRTVAKWLHKYNVVRVPYIKIAACRQFGRDPSQPDCLRDLRVLDIGCGGGVLCEPLAQVGAAVVGVDPARTAIAVAKRHAREAGITVDYRCDSIETLARAGEKFDVVLAMEVIEHVAHSADFLDRCAELVRPGGLVILSTINRTWKSYAFAIVMGEYVLRLLPRGAHQWRKFVQPDEITSSLERNLFRVVDVSGVTMNLRSRRLQISNDSSVNYMLTAGN
jgi:2-polyprenyl-6-hydroxyphenyl methylase/3-demethylubiquinone-9 3-methyltransferase